MTIDERGRRIGQQCEAVGWRNGIAGVSLEGNLRLYGSRNRQQVLTVEIPVHRAIRVDPREIGRSHESNILLRLHERDELLEVGKRPLGFGGGPDARLSSIQRAEGLRHG